MCLHNIFVRLIFSKKTKRCCPRTSQKLSQAKLHNGSYNTLPQVPGKL